MPSPAPAPLAMRETRGRQKSVSGLPQDRPPAPLPSGELEELEVKGAFTLYACAAYLTMPELHEPNCASLRL